MRGSGAFPLALVVTGAMLGSVGAVGAPSVARARDDESSMHRVSFGVESFREVENDWVRAVVGITEEDPDSARVAERVNEAAQWGLAIAGKRSGVRVKSGAYRTYPIAEDGRIRRWRASQEIVIEGSDALAVGPSPTCRPGSSSAR